MSIFSFRKTLSKVQWITFCFKIKFTYTYSPWHLCINLQSTVFLVKILSQVQIPYTVTCLSIWTRNLRTCNKYVNIFIRKYYGVIHHVWNTVRSHGRIKGKDKNWIKLSGAVLSRPSYSDILNIPIVICMVNTFSCKQQMSIPTKSNGTIYTETRGPWALMRSHEFNG